MKRFMMVFLMGVLLLAVHLSSVSAAGDSNSGLDDGTTDDTVFCSKAVVYPVFQDKEFHFQVLRQLGIAPYGGSDINECLITASRIQPGDFESWYREWFDTAERVHIIADISLVRGHTVSARDAYLRASGYYRAAEFFLHGDPADPRILQTWEKSRDCFRKGIGLLPRPVKVVEIPYENTTLPGYFLKPDSSDEPRKTLILQTGFDGTAEEIYFSQGLAAVERGYNCLIFEGPGQGGVLREQGLHFRPDWENVVTPVVDYVLTREDVDPDCIALMGISMGGYMAQRAAAYEHRIAACVANGGVYELNYTRDFGPDELYALVNYPDEFDAGTREAMENDTSLRWSIEHGMYSFGVDTPHEFLIKSQDYTLKDCVQQISCPVLVVDSEDDWMMPGRARQLYDALESPKEYMLFTIEEGAGEHCQMGASRLSNQRVFDWLDETLEGC
jgi:pimeloyl-ACP methyl ester carboxylesterase